MTFKIQSLEGISITQITQTFNEAFKHYFVPIHLTEQSLLDKIKAEDIDLNYSAGAFYNNRLIGFIFIGIQNLNGNKYSYNAGTGVLHDFQGHHVTEKMYEFILPKLDEIHIDQHQLEVITENERAIHVYKKIGYRVNRTLVCYKGHITNMFKNDTIELKEIKLLDELELSSWWNAYPSWQNSFRAIINMQESFKTIGAYLQNSIVGYIIYSVHHARIKQFAVKNDVKKMGIGTSLFAYAYHDSNKKEIVITNIDELDTETDTFLKSINLMPFLKQFEMILE